MWDFLREVGKFMISKKTICSLSVEADPPSRIKNNTDTPPADDVIATCPYTAFVPLGTIALKSAVSHEEVTLVSFTVHAVLLLAAGI